MKTTSAEKGQYSLTEAHEQDGADSPPNETVETHEQHLVENDIQLGCNASWKESILAWRLEAAAWLLSCACTVALFLVLSAYDGKPTPKWHYSLTLNALTAILTTIARVALSVPIVEGISQLKWLLFAKKTRSIMHFQHFDKASRGFVGSLSFLTRPECL
jgi:hypothetical protein